MGIWYVYMECDSKIRVDANTTPKQPAQHLIYYAFCFLSKERKQKAKRLK